MLCKTPIHTVDGVLINPFSMFSQDDKIYSCVHTRGQYTYSCISDKNWCVLATKWLHMCANFHCCMYAYHRLCLFSIKIRMHACMQNTHAHRLHWHKHAYPYMINTVLFAILDTKYKNLQFSHTTTLQNVSSKPINNRTRILHDTLLQVNCH